MLTELFSRGLLLMIAGVAIGPLPGPGFLIVCPLGLTLCLQNSAWAKRVYVRFKWRHPRYGDWADRIMRRVSAARRRRSEEHTSELQSLMRISYAVFCLKKKITKTIITIT